MVDSFNDLISTQKYNLYDPFTVGGIKFCVSRQSCDTEALQNYLGKNYSFVAGLLLCMSEAGIISSDENGGYVFSTDSVGEALKMFYEYYGKYGERESYRDFSINSIHVRKVIEISLEKGKFSTSLLQTYLGLGNSSLARIAKLLEEKGIIGPVNGNKPRNMLIKTMAEAEKLLAEEENEN